MISGFLEPPISTRQGLHGFNQGWFLVGYPLWVVPLGTSMLLIMLLKFAVLDHFYSSNLYFKDVGSSDLVGRSNLDLSKWFLTE